MKELRELMRNHVVPGWKSRSFQSILDLDDVELLDASNRQRGIGFVFGGGLELLVRWAVRGCCDERCLHSGPLQRKLELHL